MRKRRFIQCDVFTASPTYGNALAVVLDAEDVSDSQLQQFAAWTNLAETTFVLPSTDSSVDYKVRILTPTRELPFAGHPTLGTCAAWLHCGGQPKHARCVRQECGVGIVDIDISGSVSAFVAPATKIIPMSEARQTQLFQALKINPANVVRTAVLDNGPVWQVIELDSAEVVLNIDSSLVRWAEFNAIGLIGPHSSNAECNYEVRTLAPSSGMSEDPISGSLIAAIALWMLEEDRFDQDYIVAQGTVIGRRGRVHVSRSKNDSQAVLIGGQTHILVEGSVLL